MQQPELKIKLKALLLKVQFNYQLTFHKRLKYYLTYTPNFVLVFPCFSFYLVVINHGTEKI